MAYTALGKQAMLFFNSNLFRFICVAFFLLPSGMHRYAQKLHREPSSCSYFFPPNYLKTRREWENTGTAWTSLSSSPYSAGPFFLSFVAEFFGPPFFFIRFRIHMYNRYPESERVLVRFIKSLAGKTAKGYKRGRDSARHKRARKRERIAIWDSVSWDHGFCYPPLLSDGTGDQVR